MSRRSEDTGFNQFLKFVELRKNHTVASKSLPYKHATQTKTSFSLESSFMPKELPKAAELWEGAVTFFSIDTDLIQSAGYNFGAGALHQLPAQLPTAMELQLTEVVAQEILKHQMEPVLKAMDQLKSSSKALKRTGSINMEQIDQDFEKLGVEVTAAAHFRQQIDAYALRCRGGILPISGENLAAQVFELYFKGGAPFGLRVDKKSEFPDATSLIILENYAKDNETKGIVASRDGGVSDFSAQSDYIYCVKSIEDLATLFAATGEHAEKIKARVIDAISDENSTLREQLRDAVSDHIINATWEIGEISSSTVMRVEGEAYEAELDDYEINIKQAEIWESKNDPGVWIVELITRATATISVDVAYFVWDSIDREELELDRQPVEAEASIKFKTFLSCSAITEDNEPEEWSVSVDIAAGSYLVDVGNVEPDFSDQDYEE